MSKLLERMQADLNAARRDRDKLRITLISMTLSEAKNRRIELGRDLMDDDVLEVVNRAVKRRREAADQIRAAGREELAEKEDREAELLSEYLPAGLSEAEVRALVRAAIGDGASSMGAVMAAVMPKIKGRFDGREANRIVREELG